ncbi:MAG: 30S ribosomal protein S13 [Deltaproteobacteria bacterium]|nr:30S ribosomal protein S13 [Deltaproteobacteria bacterium]MCX7952843.1 30S ribosomal protein S13 [Deltaproteobacteria bacterium]
MRIGGVEIPEKKPVGIALRTIYGIGRTTGILVCKAAGVDPTRRVKDLDEEEASKIRNIIESNFAIEGELRRQVQQNIKSLIDLGTYRGMRHKRNLPVRGQRTKTNARTRKGPKKGPIPGKKVAPKK